MKDLASLLKKKYGQNSITDKRAHPNFKAAILSDFQIGTGIRREDILLELGKGWSMRAIWEVLRDNKEITCSYKTFAGHVRRLQVKAPASAITPEKEKNFTWD